MTPRVSAAGGSDDSVLAPQFGDRRPVASNIVVIAAIALGLFGSLKVVLSLVGLDADTSHSIMLWQGVVQHGWSWIGDWLFTQDNWLFSLVPLHFAAFATFGPRPGLVIVFGWLIYVASALACGFIATRIGARKAFAPIVVCLVNLGMYAHGLGFVSYSVSHNITNLFGLLCIVVLVAWCTRPRAYQLALLFVLLACGAVSDPWMLPAYNLPILIVALILLVHPMGAVDRTKSASLVVVAALSIVIVKTRLFGILDFLPPTEFAPADWQTINANLIYLVRDLGGLLNIVPFARANDFLPALVSLMVLGIVLQHGIAKAFAHRTASGLAARLYFMFVFFSVGGIAGAFVISGVEAQDHSARFVINCAYLIITTIAVLATVNWPLSGPWVRRGQVAVLGLFLASTWISIADPLVNGSLRLKDDGLMRDIQFLQKHELPYGYGGYWGAKANPITAASQGGFVIRPVSFNKTTGFMVARARPESSMRWYTPADLPVGVNRYFVIVKADGEECPDVTLCVRGLTRQFGKPIERLEHDGAIVLVWDHRLIDFERPPIEIRRNDRVTFDESGVIVTGSGWFDPELWGIWTNGATSRLKLMISDPGPGDLVMTVEGRAFVVGAQPTQTVRVVVNDRPVGVMSFDLTRNAGARTFTIPQLAILDRGGLLDIRFEVDKPRSPLELGLSSDGRKIGFGLSAIRIE